MLGSLVFKDKKLLIGRNYSVRGKASIDDQKKSCNGILRYSLEKCGITTALDANGYCSFHGYQHSRLSPQLENCTKAAPPPVIKEKVPQPATLKEKKTVQPTVKERVREVVQPPTGNDARGKEIEHDKGIIETNELADEATRTPTPPTTGKAAKGKGRVLKEKDRVIAEAIAREKEKLHALAKEKDKERLVKEIQKVQAIVKENIEKDYNTSNNVKEEKKNEQQTKSKPTKREPAEDHEKVSEPYYWDSPSIDVELAEGPIWSGEFEIVEWIDELKPTSPPHVSEARNTHVNHNKNTATNVSEVHSDGHIDTNDDSFFLEDRDASKASQSFSSSSTLGLDSYDLNNNRNDSAPADNKKESLNGTRASFRAEKQQLQFGHLAERNKQVTQYIFKFEDMPRVASSVGVDVKNSDPFAVEWEY
jgi:hypothetical protein